MGPGVFVGLVESGLPQIFLFLFIIIIFESLILTTGMRGLSGLCLLLNLIFLFLCVRGLAVGWWRFLFYYFCSLPFPCCKRDFFSASFFWGCAVSKTLDSLFVGWFTPLKDAWTEEVSISLKDGAALGAICVKCCLTWPIKTFVVPLKKKIK